MNATGQMLFEANKQQREQLKKLTNLLTNLVERVEKGIDPGPTIAEAKRYLLIETSLYEFIEGEVISDRERFGL